MLLSSDRQAAVAAEQATLDTTASTVCLRRTWVGGVGGSLSGFALLDSGMAGSFGNVVGVA